MSSKKKNGRIGAITVFLFVSINLIRVAVPEASSFPSQNSTAIQQILQYDSYTDTCMDAEKIVWSGMMDIMSKDEHAPAQLLRLLFHDCFIQGCDASVLLKEPEGMTNQTTERNAGPNRTLKGFKYVDIIKEQVERKCPGVVSCADILVLATRDAIALSGGPYYPIITGRKDSIRSYTNEAEEEIPRPDSNISQTLQLFGKRGFNGRETVALLGAHSIGKISCEFIEPRVANMIEGTIPYDLLSKMKRKCPSANGSMSDLDTSLKANRKSETPKSMQYYQGLSSTNPASTGGFGNHYYRALTKGRGLLTADQELMADEETAKAVFEYAEDVNKFFLEFSRAMVKLSNLNVLLGTDGEVRRNCSRVNSS